MVAHRKPSKILELSGAKAKNPQRFTDRESEPEVTEPIGDCPKRLSKDHRDIWNELKADCIDGVLSRQDRAAFEILVCGMHSFRHGLIDKDGELQPMKQIEIDRVFRWLCKFGLTPVDRTHLSVSKDDKKESEGFNRL